jgi:hypothetical protein
MALLVKQASRAHGSAALICISKFCALHKWQWKTVEQALFSRLNPIKVGAECGKSPRKFHRPPSHPSRSGLLEVPVCWAICWHSWRVFHWDACSSAPGAHFFQFGWRHWRHFTTNHAFLVVFLCLSLLKKTWCHVFEEFSLTHKNLRWGDYQTEWIPLKNMRWSLVVAWSRGVTEMFVGYTSFFTMFSGSVRILNSWNFLNHHQLSVKPLISPEHICLC